MKSSSFREQLRNNELPTREKHGFISRRRVSPRILNIALPMSIEEITKLRYLSSPDYILVPCLLLLLLLNPTNTMTTSIVERDMSLPIAAYSKA